MAEAPPLPARRHHPRQPVSAAVPLHQAAGRTAPPSHGPTASTYITCVCVCARVCHRPSSQSHWHSPEVEQDFELVQDLVRVARSLRAQCGLTKQRPPSRFWSRRSGGGAADTRSHPAAAALSPPPQCGPCARPARPRSSTALEQPFGPSAGSPASTSAALMEEKATRLLLLQEASSVWWTTPASYTFMLR